MMKKPLHEDIVKASNFMLGENKNFSDLTPNQKYLRFIGLRRLGLTFYCLNILSKKKPNKFQFDNLNTLIKFEINQN